MDSTVNFEVLSTQPEIIGPTKAAQYLVLDMEVQRAIRPRRVAQYAEAMRSGEWGGGDGMVIIGETPGGKRLLMAGYHRLNAILVARIPCFFTVQIRRYVSEAALLLDYAATTNRGLNAGKGDEVKALGTGSSLGLSNDAATKYVRALGFIANGFVQSRNKSQHGMWIHDAFKNWESEINYYHRAITECPKSLLVHYQRIQVTALILTTLRFSKEKAVTFLSETCADSGLRRDTPQWQFNEYIRGRECSIASKYFEYTVGLARIWNAYYEGRELKQVKTFSNDPGVRILGTPFNGTLTDGVGIVGGKAR